MFLFLTIICIIVQTATAQTMSGYIATSVSVFGRTNNSTYSNAIPIPNLNELKTTYANLPVHSCQAYIQVAASSINPSDIHPSIAKSLLPHVMGSDISGTVLNISGNDCRVKIGDRIYGDIGANTFTLKNNQKTKELGAYAEYATVLDTQVAVIPEALNFLEAASLPKVALTSIKALTWYGGARNVSFQNATVLILGGSGGTGTTGIQLAKYYGASNIITTTSGPNAKYCSELGATRIINYHTTNWWDETVLQNATFDLIYDTVGQDNTGDRAMRLLKQGGYYVTITGQLAKQVPAGITQSMFINSDTNLNSYVLMDELAKISSMNQLRMKRLSTPYTLNTIDDGFIESQSGHVVGKLVVKIN